MEHILRNNRVVLLRKLGMRRQLRQHVWLSNLHRMARPSSSSSSSLFYFYLFYYFYFYFYFYFLLLLLLLPLLLLLIVSSLTRSAPPGPSAAAGPAGSEFMECNSCPNNCCCILFEQLKAANHCTPVTYFPKDFPVLELRST